MLNDLCIQHIYIPTSKPIKLFNDNTASVCWFKKTTTKGLHHITICENAIQEYVDNEFVSNCHIGSKQNLADIFTKEFKDISLFLTLRNMITSVPLEILTNRRMGRNAHYAHVSSSIRKNY